MTAIDIKDFTQCYRSPISQLSGPMPKLVSPVASGVCVHPLKQIITRQDVNEILLFNFIRRYSKKFCYFHADRY